MEFTTFSVVALNFCLKVREKLARWQKQIYLNTILHSFHNSNILSFLQWFIGTGAEQGSQGKKQLTNKEKSTNSEGEKKSSESYRRENNWWFHFSLMLFLDLFYNLLFTA